MLVQALKTNFYHWILASRPKTLTQSLVPVFVGTWLARDVVGQINWPIALLAFFAAFFIQIGTNLFNDALDFKKGADSFTRLGPNRATQNGWFTTQQVISAGFLCFALALLCAIPLFIQGGSIILVMTLVCLGCGYLYTGGPFPLAYYGLGDLFVLIFFGIVATSFTYYLQTGTFDTSSFLAGTQIGLLSTVLITINNLRDIDGDIQANKYTLAAMFGKRFARWEITILIGSAYLLGIFWLFTGHWTAMLCPLATIPQGIKLINNVWQNEPGVIYNTFLADAAWLHLTFGIVLGLSYSFS